MTHITGHDRYQMLLLPEAVDDYVAADNPVRSSMRLLMGLTLSPLGLPVSCRRRPVVLDMRRATF
jgi:hypothetical protein